MGALDGAQSAREGGSDGGEDQQGHTVADATLGNLLTHPHDDGGTCTQGDDNQQDVQYVVLGDDAGAVAQQNAGARHRDDGGCVQQSKSDGQVAGVLGELCLTLCAFIVQLLESRDDHAQQLDDNGRGNVRHHAEGKDRKLQQCATAEEVDDIVDATARNIGVQTLLYISVGNAWRGDESAHAVQHNHCQGKQQLTPQIGGLNDSPECAQHMSSCKSMGRPSLSRSFRAQ